MPLTLLTGHANTGKTGVVHDALRRAIVDGREGVLLLPSTPDVLRTRDELADEALLGLRITRFDRYLESLWALHGDGRRLLGPAQRLVLIQAAVAETAAEQALPPGAVRLLAAVLERWPDAGRGSKRTDMVRIISAYHDLCRGSGLVEPAEAWALLARHAPPAAGLLAVHRFAGLSREQEGFVAAQAGAGAEVLLTLPWRPGAPAMAALDPLVTRLAALPGCRLAEASETYTRSAELRRLERGLFRAPDPVPTEGDVRLLLAAGEEAEAAAIADEVVALRAEGVPADHIAIVYRNPARHVPWLRRALTERGLSFDLDLRLPLSAAPFGRAILHLTHFVTAGYKRTDLLAFLRSPASGADPSAVDRLEQRWRERRLADGPELLAGLRECGVSCSALVREADRAARGMLDETGLRRWQRVFDAALRGSLSVREPRADVDAAAHAAIVAALDELGHLRGLEKAPVDLGPVLDGVRFRPSRVERPGHVQVMDAERARFRRFDAVLIGGLTASEMPRRSDTEGYGSEALGAFARRLGLEPPDVAEDARERLLFYQLVTRAGRRLVLSRQYADSAGRPVRESPYWDELLDLYRDPVEGGVDHSSSIEPRLVAAPRGRAGAVATEPRADVVAVIADTIRQRETFSASDIEAYLGCPYRWFYDRRLRPEGLDRDLDPRETGTLAHRALKLFYDAFRDEIRADRVTSDNLTRALGLGEAAFEEARRDAPDPRDLEEEEKLLAARSAVLRLIERDAAFLPGYRPIAFEWRFGVGDEAAAQFDGFALAGSVDRIDEGPDGLVAIDYKSGTATPQAKFADRGVLQVPLYAAAASACFGKPVAGGLYRSLKGQGEDRGFVLPSLSGPGLKRTDAVTTEERDALLADAVRRAADAVSGMRAGNIARAPLVPEQCRYCGARHFCEKGGPDDVPADS